MALLFSTLLIIFLLSFFGLEHFANNVMLASDIRVLGISILSEEFRAFLGVGTIFCEAALIFFVMLDKVGDVVRAALKPVVRLIPLGAFLFAAWDTLTPILVPLFPDSVGRSLGVANNVSIQQTVNTGSFATGVVITLVTMLFFALTANAIKSPESERIRRLEAELARYKKML